MGCDIRVYLEKKNSETEKWEQIKIYRKNDADEYEVVYPYEGRNYALFSVLAGVRGWYDALVSPRGVPKDMSEEVAKQWKEEEEWCHTPTWYDLRELSLLCNALPEESNLDEDEWGQKEVLQSFIRDLDTYIEYAGNYWWGEEIGKYRVIIWFDN